jgi:protein required for attachment to host cells
MKGIWVLVTDGSVARFMEAEGPEYHLREIETIESPQNMAWEARAQNAGGLGNAYSGRDTQRGYGSQERDFARAINERLAMARREGRLKELVLVAPADVMMRVRNRLAPDVAELLLLDVVANLVRQPPHVIRAHLPDGF